MKMLNLLIFGLVFIVCSSIVYSASPEIIAYDRTGREINIPFTYKDKEITVKSDIISANFQNATIKIPHNSNKNVMKVPSLHIREDEAFKTTETIPYEKGDYWYNVVRITKDYYEFSVEHFTTYYINDTADYDSVQDCFNAINDTTDECELKASNYSETFYPAKYVMNSTTFKLQINDRENVRIDFNDSDFNIKGAFLNLYGSYNLTFENVVVNHFEAGDMIIGGTGLLGNYTFNNFNTSEGCEDYINFGTGNPQNTLNINNSYLNCTRINHYASNLAIHNNVFDRLEIFISWNIKITAVNNIFQNDAYITFSAPTTGILQDNIFNSSFEYDAIGDSLENMTIQGNTFNNLNTSNTLYFYQRGDSIIQNNTFYNCGHKSISYHYSVSYYPINVSGVSYDDCVKWIRADQGAIVDSASDNTTMPSWVDGSTDFDRAWAYTDTNNIIGCGAGAKTTVYLEEGYPLTCPQIVGPPMNYGGSCDWVLEVDAVKSNGAGNDYTFNDTIPTNTNVTEPPWMVYASHTVWNHSGIYINESDNITIRYNTFTGDSPIYTNASNITIYYNNFLTDAPRLFGNYSLCDSGMGNFFEETLTPSEGDCGLSNITSPLWYQWFDTNEIFMSAWTRQSGTHTINYAAIINNTDGNMTLINETTYLNQIVIAADYGDGNHSFNLIPFINFGGVRYNGTRASPINFTIQDYIKEGLCPCSCEPSMW